MTQSRISGRHHRALAAASLLESSGPAPLIIRPRFFTLLRRLSGLRPKTAPVCLQSCAQTLLCNRDLDSVAVCLSLYEMPNFIEKRSNSTEIALPGWRASSPETVPGESDVPWEDRDPDRQAISFARRLGPEDGIGWHSHFRAQLIFSESRTLRVATEKGTWLVPPQLAVFVPSGHRHSISNTAGALLLSLYLHPDLGGLLPRTCRVFEVSPLLRALLQQALTLEPQARRAECGTGQTAPRPDSANRLKRLQAVILDEIAALQEAPLHLPLPKDSRIRRITEALMAQPADKRTLADWSADAGASERTLARAFVRETGLTFGAWRQRLRLLQAIDLLSRGRRVSDIAYGLGYESPSAFIAMFRRETGCAPRRFREQGWRSLNRDG